LDNFGTFFPEIFEKKYVFKNAKLKNRKFSGRILAKSAIFVIFFFFGVFSKNRYLPADFFENFGNFPEKNVKKTTLFGKNDPIFPDFSGIFTPFFS